MTEIELMYPRLRRGYAAKAIPGGVSILRRGEEYAQLELSSHNRSESIAQLLNSLDGTLSLASIEARCGDGVEAQKLIALLDTSMLLCEGRVTEAPGVVSGAAFIRELEQAYDDWTDEKGETEFSTRFLDGELPREVVVGWAFESYHITLRAHDCIAPALIRSEPHLRESVFNYFADEYRHDKLLLKSIEALGYSRADIKASVPLPYTSAIMNHLGKWAQSDQLSFFACLFVFEGSPVEGDEYIAGLKRYDLPDAFVAPQSVHNDINKDGDHGNVSRHFFKNIDCISTAAQRRVRENIRLLFELEHLHNQQVFSYYQNPVFGVPRKVILTDRTAGMEQ